MNIVKLKKPISRGPEFISVLEFRRPNFGDLQAINLVLQTESFDHVVTLVSRLSGVPRDLVELVDLEDVEALVTGLNQHLEATQAEPPKLH
jgi:hypothetical protein